MRLLLLWFLLKEALNEEGSYLRRLLLKEALIKEGISMEVFSKGDCYVLRL